MREDNPNNLEFLFPVPRAAAQFSKHFNCLKLVYGMVLKDLMEFSISIFLSKIKGKILSNNGGRRDLPEDERSQVDGEVSLARREGHFACLT